MRLTTKGRYAVTAMLDLTIHSVNGLVPLADVARRQCISLSYLEQLFARLRRNGLVDGVRGPGGGYGLGRPADQISVADVIGAVDEKIDSTHCGGQKNCKNGKPCLTHDLWMSLSEEIRRYLSGIMLSDLVARVPGDALLSAGRGGKPAVPVAEARSGRG